jgi:hypothetical protein
MFSKYCGLGRFFIYERAKAAHRKCCGLPLRESLHDFEEESFNTSSLLDGLVEISATPAFSTLVWSHG